MTPREANLRRVTRVPLVRVTIGLCALSAAALLAQQPKAPPDKPQTPVFRSGVEAVQMDVFVTDENDRPVTGLTVDDFEVFENGQPQAITTFAPVSMPLERSEPLPFDAEPDVQTNVREHRHVYLFLLTAIGDGEFTLKTRQLLRRFITEHFSDDDIAAVVVDSGLVTDGQDFTSNRRLLLAAIDRYSGGHQRFGSPSRELALYAQDLWERMELMARIPGGRKSVLWFTNPIYAIDPFPVIDYRGGVPPLLMCEYVHAAVAAATRANIRIYPIDSMGLRAGGGLGAGTASRPRLTSALPMTTCSGTPEDQLSALEPAMNVRKLAEVTGGFAHVASNDFTGTFERLVRETSTYYVLGFNSTFRRKQGRHVELDVRVKRPGLKVRSRTGYVEQLEYIRANMPPEPRRSPIETVLANPLATPGIPMRVVAAPYKKSGKTATVALAIELDGGTLGFTEQGGRYSARVEVRHLATDAKAKIHPEHRHSTALGLSADAYREAAATGIRIVSEFDLPAGRYQVRVASATGAGDGSVVYDLEVPDFRNGPLAISGVALATQTAPEVLTLRPDRNQRGNQKTNACRERVCNAGVTVDGTLAPWTDPVRDGDAQLLRDVLPAPPTTAREFGGEETLVLFAEVYDNNGRVRKDPPYDIELSARLHAADGTLVRLASEQRSSRAARRPSGGHGFTLRLALDNAPAGRYVLKVEARSTRDPTHQSNRNIPIRVK